MDGQQGLTGLLGWLLTVVETLGPVGVGLLVVVDTVFPPVPSELFLPLAGFLAGQGQLSLTLAWLGATAGSLVGALVLYRLGSAVGEERSERLLARLPLVDRADLERGEAVFRRHGAAAVLLGRLVPGVRSVVSLPAGIEGMPLVRFCLLTTAGSAAWNALLIGGGYLLGRRWRTVADYSDYLNYALYAVVALLVARLVWKRRARVPFLPDPASR